MNVQVKRGFTLIELLVVIAIIGLLSSIVLASLSSSRLKATDTQIKSNLHSAVNQAGIDYDSYPNSYGAPLAFAAVTKATLQTVSPGTGVPGTAGVGIFNSGATGDSAGTNALIQAGIAGGMLYYGLSSNAFFVAVPLVANPNTFWCVDSGGAAKVENATPNSTTYASLACP